MALTEKQRLRLLNRAATLHSKACELFELAEEIFGKDDERMIPYFGDTMCSEGKPYPRSSCVGCGRTITTGLGRECSRPADRIAQLERELAEARAERSFWEDRENKAIIRAETAEAERDRLAAALVRAEEIAAEDRRSDSAKKSGYKPEWYKHGLSIAKRIGNLRRASLQTGEPSPLNEQALVEALDALKGEQP